MNPASRIFNVVDSLNNINNKSMRLVDAYKEVFKCDTLPSVYKALVLLDKEVSLLENIFISSKKQEKYKELISSLRKISTPENFGANIVHIDSYIKTVLPKLDVLSDALESHIVEEVDISKKLSPILSDLDNFMSKIMDLDVDDNTKVTYLKISSLLKESISYYHITGTKEVNFVLKQFDCITKDIPDAKPISQNLSNALSDAANLSTLLGFVAGTVITPLIGG